MRTSLSKDAAEARGWGANLPTYWIAILDGQDCVLESQRLTSGFRRGEEPNTDGAWSTFDLELRQSERGVLATITVWEPSPSGTAWGRNGFVRFGWPRFEPLEWEYQVLHYINHALESTERWSWIERAGSSEYPGLEFRYILPQVSLDDEFVNRGWVEADFSACSSRLSARNAIPLAGSGLSPHALRAVLSSQSELFLELEGSSGRPVPKDVILELCYAGGGLRSVPSEPAEPAPRCVSFTVLGAGATLPVQVSSAAETHRVKVTLPHDELAELPALTLILRDTAHRQSLASSRFDFKTSRRLGEVLSFAPERVSCALESGRLVPHFAASDPEQGLLDQVR